MRIFRIFPLFVAVSLATLWLVIGLTAFAQGEPGQVADSSGESADAPAIVTAVADTDVGVIPGAEGCPPTAEMILINMDDEDNDNTSYVEKWTGAIAQNRSAADLATYTRLVFCRVAGAQFKHWAADDSYGSGAHGYAVLKLGDSCPNDSVDFARYFDNQDGENNANDSSGNLYPNVVSQNTRLQFCFFEGHYDDEQQYADVMMSEFPGLGFEYGVLADSDFLGAKETGIVYTDDENDENENRLEISNISASQRANVELIVSGEHNTTMSLARVTEPSSGLGFGLTCTQQECARAIPVNISLYRSPDEATRATYEELIRYFADAVLEMSNGVHLIGKVNIYTNKVNWNDPTTDIQWVASEDQIRANPGAYHFPPGYIYMGDEDPEQLKCQVNHPDGKVDENPVDLNYLKTGRVCDEIYLPLKINNDNSFFWTQFGGYTLAHEWGHYYYSLRDEYPQKNGDVTIESIMGSTHAGTNAVSDKDTLLNFSSKEPLWNQQNEQYRTWDASAWTVLGRPHEEDIRRVITYKKKRETGLGCIDGCDVIEKKRVVHRIPIKENREDLPELYDVNPLLTDDLYYRWPFGWPCIAQSCHSQSKLDIEWIDQDAGTRLLDSDSGQQTISQSPSITPFFVNSGWYKAGITILYNDRVDKKIGITIRDSGGQVRATVNCPFTGRKEGACTAEVQNPEPGAWVMEVATDSPPLTYKYSVKGYVQNVGPLYQAEVGSHLGNVVRYPDPVVVLASVRKDLPIAKATLVVKATSPDGQPFNLVLKDDGVSPDALADDGIYAGYLDYPQNGPYHITVTFDNGNGNAVFTSLDMADSTGSPYPVGENFKLSAATVIYVVGIKDDDHSNTCAEGIQIPPTNIDVPGQIDSPGDKDFFKVVATSTQQLAVRVAGLGFGMEPGIRILAQDGVTVLKEVKFDPNAALYPYAVFDAIAGVTYCVEISHLKPEADKGSYYVSIGAPLPSGGEDQSILQIAPATLIFNATAGGSSPAPQTISISNVGAGTLTWTANEAIPWLNLTPPLGSAPATVEASANIAGLAAGLHSGTITIVAGTQTSTVTVNLTVSSLPPVTPTKPITLEVDSGNKSMQLTWNVTNDPDVASYRIQRAVGPNGAFGLIAPNVTNTAYFDTDNNGSNNLAEGTTYCYKVEALRANGQVVLTSNVACALFGKLDLWIPDTIGKPGAVVIVPINIRNADGLRIGSSDIWMDFNPTVLESVAVSRTALTASYAWAHSVNVIDAATSRVRIAYIHSDLNNPPPELHGDGSLFWFTFRVKGLPGSTSPLNLKEFITAVGGSSIQNETLAEVNLTLTDGLFTVEGEATAKYILGDVDADTLVRARDAALALRLANGERTPTQLELLAGDVNGNGKIDTPDSSMILYFAAKNEWPQPPKLLVGAAAVAEPSQSATVRLDNGQGKQGENVQITLSASGLSNVAGGHFVLVYDPRIVQAVTAVSKSGLAANFDSLEFAAGDGLLSISFSDDNAINGDGALATITLALASNAAVGVAPLTLAEAKLNDLMGRDFVTNFAGNTLTRQSAQITVQAGDPVNNNRNIYLPLVSR